MLLVGGSTYDHNDRLNIGAVTFIPGHYGQSSYSHYTLSDVPYVMDAGTDEIFASIGRWPVRSRADLRHIVNKSIHWSSRDHNSGKALLIAEHTIQGIDFDSALDTMATLVPATWTTTNVYVDDIRAANSNLSLTQVLVKANSEIINQLNSSPDMVLYHGHASTTQLSNKGLFKSSHLDKVTAGGAAVWLPMSCYVTYYESTHVNTLAHQLLFNANAVNIAGAMLLADHSENLVMGTAVLETTMNGARLGTALNQVKAAQKNPLLNINWGLLGDPTTSF